MMSKENILELEARRKIYRFILYNPGFHKREISRDLDIPKTTLSYHLNYLIKRELIIEKKENGYNRYFISKIKGTYDKKTFGLIRQKVPRNIILLLCLYITLSRKDLFKCLKKDLNTDKHRTTIDFHLNKLARMNVIESKKIGKEKFYEIIDRELYIDFLIVYEKQFNESLRVSYFLFHMNDLPIEEIDNLLKITFEILPHPYHV